MSGGLLESCTSTAIRPRPPVVLLPDRGPFAFPAPYNTTGIRLTNERDMGGNDALWPTGYAYWQGINAHAGEPELLVFLGLDRTRGGAGPCLYHVDKATLEVTPMGPLFDENHPLSWATGEGWYFSATDPWTLYVSDDEHLYRLDVRTHELVTVVDITACQWMGKFALRQWHTSRDGKSHSATVKAVTATGAWPTLGTIVYREDLPQPPRWFPQVGALDESQIDHSGEWLLVKDNLDGQDGEDNRLIRLADGGERVLMDRDGAAGHSDNGFGYMVAADNWNALPFAWRVWMFDGSEPQGRVVYHAPSWDAPELQHVSHCHARPGSPDGQWVLGSGATRIVGPRANELVVVPLDGSLNVLVIAPTLVDLDAAGGGGDDYAKLPKANTDPTGEFALWTSNHGSSRLDAFLVKIPTEGL